MIRINMGTGNDEQMEGRGQNQQSYKAETEKGKTDMDSKQS